MNSLIKHGAIRVSKNKKYLEYEDGTPFFWLADTWWYGMTKRTRWEDFETLVQDRKKKGFTVIQTVVGVPPEVDIFSPQAGNSGGLPFIKRFSVIPNLFRDLNSKKQMLNQVQHDNIDLNLKYFIEVDKKIKYLVDNDLVPCIFGAWGHHIDILGVDLIKKWWGEIVRRYAKYPVVWCLTGEADIFLSAYSFNNSFIKKMISYLPNNLKQLIMSFRIPIFIGINFVRNLAKRIYLKKTLTLDSSIATLPRNDIIINNKIRQRVKKWDEVARYIKKIDKFNRLLTVHIHSRTTASQLFGDPDWLDIDSIQSGHSKDSLEFMKNSISQTDKRKRPIINLEPWYEGILGNFWVKDQLLAFWACIKAGVAGHSYGTHGIWQMATSEDNFMGHWGRSDWKKAIKYSGAEAIGKAKKKLERNWPIILKSDLV